MKRSTHAATIDIFLLILENKKIRIKKKKIVAVRCVSDAFFVTHFFGNLHAAEAIFVNCICIVYKHQQYLG